MKVFISWSGEPSKKVAKSLREYLPSMIPQLHPFMSESDIPSGTKWLEKLFKELEESEFGIVCLTPGNQREPWILFEAGALAKEAEGRVCCLLMGGLEFNNISRPLSYFQNLEFSREGLLKLLLDMNNLLITRVKSLADDEIEANLDKYWPDLNKEVELAIIETKRHKTTNRGCVENVINLVNQFLIAHSSENIDLKDVRGRVHIREKVSPGLKLPPEWCLSPFCNYPPLNLKDNGFIPLDRNEYRAWYVNVKAFHDKDVVFGEPDHSKQPKTADLYISKPQWNRTSVISIPIYHCLHSSLVLGTLTFDSIHSLEELKWGSGDTANASVSEMLSKAADLIGKMISDDITTTQI